MRKYTVDEIDEMRSILHMVIGYKGPPQMTPYYQKDEDRKEANSRSHIEDRLRTYMTAGVTPAQLRKKYLG